MNKWLIITALALAMLGGGAAGYLARGNPGVGLAIDPAPAPSPVAVAGHMPGPLGDWTGNGNLNTETFEVRSGSWVLAWAARDTSPVVPGNLIVFIHRDGGELDSVAVNALGGGSGRTVLRGAGRYYLEVIGANNRWSLSAAELP